MEDLEDTEMINGKTSEQLAGEAVVMRARVIKMKDDLREHPCWKKYRITSDGYKFRVARHRYLWKWDFLIRINWRADIVTEFNTLEDVYAKIQEDIEKRKRQSSPWEIIDEIG